jgi:hypothetical protein
MTRINRDDGEAELLTGGLAHLIHPAYVDRFDEILASMSALHNKKGQDYGSAGDPYANVRASQEFGCPPWVGAIIRMNDKLTRIKSFLRKGGLANESLRDSLEDLGVYAVIARVLYEEAHGVQVSEDATRY